MSQALHLRHLASHPWSHTCSRGGNFFYVIIILYIVRTRFQSTWQYSRKIFAKFFIYIYISLRFATMHSSGYRLGISSGRCINRQRRRVQILFSLILLVFILFYYLFILPSGGGLVPFIHPRKYAPVHIKPFTFEWDIFRHFLMWSHIIWHLNMGPQLNSFNVDFFMLSVTALSSSLRMPNGSNRLFTSVTHDTG